MKTFVAKPETVKRDWYVVDAEGKTLGSEQNPTLLERIGGQKRSKTYSSDDMKKIFALN